MCVDLRCIFVDLAFLVKSSLDFLSSHYHFFCLDRRVGDSESRRKEKVAKRKDGSRKGKGSGKGDSGDQKGRETEATETRTRKQRTP